MKPTFLRFVNISECSSAYPEQNGNPEDEKRELSRPPLPPKLNRSSTNLTRSSTNLIKSTRTLSDLEPSSLHDRYLSNSDFNKNWSDSNLRDSNLPDSSLRDSSLPDSNLRDSTLRSKDSNKNSLNLKQKLSLDLSGKLYIVQTRIF